MKLKSKIAIIMLFVVTVGALRAQQATSFAFEKNRELLKNVINIVKSEHYAPKSIDDNFSLKLYQATIENLDPLGQLFLKSDLKKLDRYKYMLDEEINEFKAFAFLPQLLAIYMNRLNDLEKDYAEILAQPMDFMINEDTGPMGRTTIGIAKNLLQIKESRRKRIKYLIIQQYYALRQNNPTNRDLAGLEIRARSTVKLRIQRSIERMRLLSNPTQQFEAYVDRILKIMDPHSSYLSARAEREFSELMDNNYGGLGLTLDGETSPLGVRISGLDINGSAYRSGQVMIGDIILAIGEGAKGDFREVAGMTSGEVAALIRGQLGTSLQLILLRGAEDNRHTVTLTREANQGNGSQTRTAIIEYGGIQTGYITFPFFYESLNNLSSRHCSLDVEQAIFDLQKEQVQGIIVDLRGNGGGSLREAVRMATLFLGQSPIVHIKDNKGYPIARTANDMDMMMPTGKPFFQQVYQGPLIVLVDELSASASEIFSAAMQDYGRGLIIGSSTSFGKGSVQKLIRLAPPLEGSLQLTYAQFYRVSGSSTQLKGVTPDIVIPDLNEYAGIRERDLPDPLPWDMISPSHEILEKDLSLKKLIADAQYRISADSSLMDIYDRSKEISFLKKSKVSLQYDSYNIMAKRLNKLSRLSPTKVNNDKLRIRSMFEEKDDYNLRFIEKLQSDNVINQAILTMNDLAK
ncbi:carboxy terminal-processing peptidase [Sphingobacterium puteale]|uniref:carboxy terminal-processing peptidase n=1 Tax=Sphingobacterium puteale TaxID=2420510 RepID=UPI003D9606D7